MITNMRFPDPNKSRNSYTFKKNYFRKKKIKRKILEYNNNLEGWSEQLTLLHEDTSAKYHPIEMLSRYNLINNLKIKTKQTVLEIGCSSGWLLDDLLKKYEKINYIGSDVIINPIKKLAKKYPNIPFVRFDILQNPLKKLKFNYVVMLNVLEHIENDTLAVQQVYKLLKKNGKFLIEVPANQFLYDNYDKQLKHFRRYRMLDLMKMLKKNGFEIEKKQHIGFFVFFPFLLFKFFNKIFNKDNKIVKKQIVASNNFLFRSLIAIEKKLSNIYFPFGIRCFVIARKV